jgi:hypothetical protein
LVYHIFLLDKVAEEKVKTFSPCSCRVHHKKNQRFFYEVGCKLKTLFLIYNVLFLVILLSLIT